MARGGCRRIKIYLRRTNSCGLFQQCDNAGKPVSFVADFLHPLGYRTAVEAEASEPAVTARSEVGRWADLDFLSAHFICPAFSPAFQAVAGGWADRQILFRKYNCNILYLSLC